MFHISFCRKIHSIFKALAFVFLLSFGTNAFAITCGNDEFEYNGNCIESKFEITTTQIDDDDTFSFSMSAKGTFYIDWGDGTVQEINRTNNITDTAYSHTYDTNNDPNDHTGPSLSYNIKFGGVATGYNTGYSDDSPVSAISFGANYYINNRSINTYKKVAGISKSLGALFPTIGGAAATLGKDGDDPELLGIQPRFYRTFNLCRLNGEIPANLFNNVAGQPADGMFSGTFEGCSGLTGQIPGNLFSGISGKPAKAMFSGTFGACRNLGRDGIDDPTTTLVEFAPKYSIPSGLFGNISGQPKRSMFSGTFRDCTGLTGSIPAGLFGSLDGTPEDYMFNGTFENCSHLTGSIPTGLFGNLRGQPKDYMFAWTFENCDGLTGEIPRGLFGNLYGTPAEYMFGGTFYGCSHLIGEIPDNLFGNIYGQPKERMFVSTFYNCSGLTGPIPPRLFGSLDGTPEAAMFSGTFSGCNHLTGSIPNNLFGNIHGQPVEYMFNGTFNNCSGLTGYVPPTLFYGISEGTSSISNYMSSVFNGTGLTSVCNDINASKTYTTNFENNFSYKKSCINLLKIVCPAGEHLINSATKCSSCPEGACPYATEYTCPNGYLGDSTNSECVSFPSIEYHYTYDATSAVRNPIGYYYDYNNHKTYFLYDDNSQEVMNNTSIVTLSKLSDREGFAFLAWCTDASLTTCESEPTLYFSSNNNSFDMYAKWAQVYTIHYNDMGATTPATGNPTQYYYDSSNSLIYIRDSANDSWRNYSTGTGSTNNNGYIAIARPSKTGFIFNGWYACDNEQSDLSDSAIMSNCTRLYGVSAIHDGLYLNASTYDKWLYALWAEMSTTCDAGYYAYSDGSSVECRECEPGFYCTGQNQNGGDELVAGDDNGKYACPDSAQYSKYKSTSLADCSVCPEVDWESLKQRSGPKIGKEQGILRLADGYVLQNMRWTFYKESDGVPGASLNECFVGVGGYGNVTEYQKCQMQSLYTPEEIMKQMPMERYYLMGFDKPCDWVKADIGMMTCRFDLNTGDYTDCSQMAPVCDADNAKLLATKIVEADQGGGVDVETLLNWELSAKGLTQSTVNWDNYFGQNVTTINKGTEIVRYNTCCVDGFTCCAKGTYFDAAESECVACPENSECPGGAYASDSESDLGIDSCAANAFSVAGSAACVECPASSVANKRLKTCSCNNSGFIYNTETNTCDFNSCPDGNTCCVAGTYFDKNKQDCVTCPAGSYCGGVSMPTLETMPTTGRQTCLDGYYSADGAAKCTACPAGSTSNAEHTMCICSKREYEWNSTTNKCEWNGVCPALNKTVDDRHVLLLNNGNPFVLNSGNNGELFAPASPVTTVASTVNDCIIWGYTADNIDSARSCFIGDGWCDWWSMGLGILICKYDDSVQDYVCVKRADACRSKEYSRIMQNMSDTRSALGVLRQLRSRMHAMSETERLMMQMGYDSVSMPTDWLYDGSFFTESLANENTLGQETVDSYNVCCPEGTYMYIKNGVASCVATLGDWSGYGYDTNYFNDPTHLIDGAYGNIELHGGSYISVQNGMLTLHECPAGYYCPGGFSDDLQNLSDGDYGKIQCPSNATSTAGQSACTCTDENFEWDISSCKPTKTCNNETTICCDAGTYLRYDANADKVSCSKCPEGAWCPGGSWSTSTTSDQGMNYCSTGTTTPYGESESADQCAACPAGITLNTENHECNCPDGYYTEYYNQDKHSGRLICEWDGETCPDFSTTTVNGRTVSRTINENSVEFMDEFHANLDDNWDIEINECIQVIATFKDATEAEKCMGKESESCDWAKASVGFVACRYDETIKDYICSPNVTICSPDDYGSIRNFGKGTLAYLYWMRSRLGLSVLDIDWNDGQFFTNNMLGKTTIDYDTFETPSACVACPNVPLATETSDFLTRTGYKDMAAAETPDFMFHYDLNGDGELTTNECFRTLIKADDWETFDDKEGNYVGSVTFCQYNGRNGYTNCAEPIRMCTPYEFMNLFDVVFKAANEKNGKKGDDFDDAAITHIDISPVLDNFAALTGTTPNELAFETRVSVLNDAPACVVCPDPKETIKLADGYVEWRGKEDQPMAFAYDFNADGQRTADECVKPVIQLGDGQDAPTAISFCRYNTSMQKYYGNCVTPLATCTEKSLAPFKVGEASEGNPALWLSIFAEQTELTSPSDLNFTVSGANLDSGATCCPYYKADPEGVGGGIAKDPTYITDGGLNVCMRAYVWVEDATYTMAACKYNAESGKYDICSDRTVAICDSATASDLVDDTKTTGDVLQYMPANVGYTTVIGEDEDVSSVRKIEPANVCCARGYYYDNTESREIGRPSSSMCQSCPEDAWCPGGSWPADTEEVMGGNMCPAGTYYPVHLYELPAYAESMCKACPTGSISTRKDNGDFNDSLIKKPASSCECGENFYADYATNTCVWNGSCPTFNHDFGKDANITFAFGAEPMNVDFNGDGKNSVDECTLILAVYKDGAETYNCIQNNGHCDWQRAGMVPIACRYDTSVQDYVCSKRFSVCNDTEGEQMMSATYGVNTNEQAVRNIVAYFRDMAGYSSWNEMFIYSLANVSTIYDNTIPSYNMCCAEGQYLDASGAVPVCTECHENHFCPGGAFPKNATVNAGEYACPTDAVSPAGKDACTCDKEGEGLSYWDYDAHKCVVNSCPDVPIKNLPAGYIDAAMIDFPAFAYTYFTDATGTTSDCVKFAIKPTDMTDGELTSYQDLQGLAVCRYDGTGYNNCTKPATPCDSVVFSDFLRAGSTDAMMSVVMNVLGKESLSNADFYTPASRLATASNCSVCPVGANPEGVDANTIVKDAEYIAAIDNCAKMFIWNDNRGNTRIAGCVYNETTGAYDLCANHNRYACGTEEISLVLSDYTTTGDFWYKFDDIKGVTTGNIKNLDIDKSCCAAGYYGTTACTACPVDTYNPDFGATNVSACVPCSGTVYTHSDGGASKCYARVKFMDSDHTTTLKEIHVPYMTEEEYMEQYDDGVAVIDDVVIENMTDNSFDLLYTPYKTSSDFLGWYDENDNYISVNKKDKDTIRNITGDVTVYAKWAYMCNAVIRLNVLGDEMCPLSEKEKDVTKPQYTLPIRSDDGGRHYILLSEHDYPVTKDSSTKLQFIIGKDGKSYYAHDSTVVNTYEDKEE